MKPEMYKKFYEMLLEKNIELVTKPEQYELMHIFPNVYGKLEKDTVKMELYPLHERIDVEKLKSNFHRFMVKDYVKSVKGTDFPRYFDQDVTQLEFDYWMEVFYKYRGHLLTGGICIKEFLNLKRYAGRTNEYRVFYINHEIATISRNSAQGIYAALPPQQLLENIRIWKAFIIPLIMRNWRMVRGEFLKPVTGKFQVFRNSKIMNSILGHYISSLCKKGVHIYASIYSCF